MSGRAVTLGLLLINLLLGLGVIGAWQANDRVAPVAVAPVAVPASVESEVSPPRFDPAPLEDYEEIVARPLFNESRRPQIEDKPAGGPAPSQAPFTLVGVIITPERTEALLRETAGKKEVLRRRVGESLQGWTIDAIEADRVAVRSGGGEVEVMLERRASTRVAPRRATRAKNRPQRPVPARRSTRPVPAEVKDKTDKD